MDGGAGIRGVTPWDTGRKRGSLTVPVSKRFLKIWGGGFKGMGQRSAGAVGTGRGGAVRCGAVRGGAGGGAG